MAETEDLVLNEDALPTQIVEDLERYFGVRELRIRENNNTPAGVDEGRCILRGIPCRVSVFRVEDPRHPLLLLVARPEEAWTFGRCFPQIQDQSKPLSLGLLSLNTDAFWIYSSPHADADDAVVKEHLKTLGLAVEVNGAFSSLTLQTAGLHMAGTLPVPDSLTSDGLFGSFLRDVLNTPVQATIDYSDVFPVLSIPIPLNQTVEFLGCSLTISRLLLSAPLYLSLRSSAVRLDAGLKLGDSTFNLWANYPLDEDLWGATITVNGDLPFVDDDIFGLSLPQVENLAMDLQFSKSENTLKRVQFDLGLDLGSEEDGIRQLLPQELAFRFILHDPFDLDARMLIATITGQVEIAQGDKVPALLSLRAGYPDGQFYLQLDPETPLYLAHLLNPLVPDLDPSDLPDGVIDELIFEFNWDGPVYLQTAIAEWQIVNEFALERLRFTFQSMPDVKRFEMVAQLAICDVPVNLAGQYGSGEGWQLEGSTGPGADILIGKLIEDITGVDDLPAAIADFTISDLGVSFNTQSKDFSFTCKGQIPVGDSEEVEVTVTIACERDSASGKYTNTYAGDVTLGDWQFEIEFSKDTNSKLLVASLDKTGTKGTIKLGDGVFSAYLDQSEALERKSLNLGSLGSALPPELAELMGKVEITPLQMALGTHKKSGNYVLALQLDGGLSLSRLPFVGERLPKGADVGIKDLGLVWCSAGLSGDKGKEARTAFVAAFQGVDLIDDDALSSGGMFSAWLTVPSQAEPFELGIPLRSQAAKSASPTTPVAGAGTTTPPATTASPVTAIAPMEPATPAPPDPVKWFKVGKNAGPLSLQRIGLKYEEKKIWFLFDASLSAGTVTLILDGLGAGLDPFALLGGRFEPAFTLRGLGLSIKGPAEISGAFLRARIEDQRGDYDEFSGVVIVKTEALTVSGMGSYADPPWGDPSFFAYAFLDKPIGGPPFFFVTGLALGIAINRNLDLPPIDQVSQFPLVRLALGEPPSPPGPNMPAVRDTGGDLDLKALLEAQQAMVPYTRPNSGQVVLAVGVRFTTFRILNSFALLVGSFGKPFKLDLLISSRMQIPALPPGSNTSPAPLPPPIAQIGIDLRGTWIPDDGVLVVEGRITEGSWFLDSACRLSGGAAFASWTSGDHADDFVMTVGGYHPRFSAPAHYPKVPRLAFQWIRGPIEIKGDGYFAMTPSALMVGGSLSATFQEGRLKAWFNCGADFLVAWEPFSYDASMHVEIGASYRTGLGTISASVSASLQLWGPDMAGIATIDLGVVEVEVKFGEDKAAPKPIDAKTFRDRFLPAKDEELLSVVVSSGLIRSGMSADGKTPLFVVNPAEFALTIESVIPKPDGTTIGIGPMGVTAATLGKKDVLTWTISKQGTADWDSSADFDPKDPDLFVEKPVPAALWGPAPAEGKVRAPGFEAKGTVINATVGYTIKPKGAPTAQGSNEYKTDLFLFNEDTWQNKEMQRVNPGWPSDGPSFRIKPKTAESVLTEIHGNPPKELVAALTGQEDGDFTGEESLSTEWLNDLQELPRVGTLEPAS